ncbi:MAG: hypothetical protein A2X59_06250 [Nitrospirae bacterium GWC2_42_7]|nr:MAG: hypothetical protein A2X59_06250 [Nitrospirae bacterium GWC2_42_7]
MFRRLLFILIACFFAISFSNSAWSSVEGTWDVSGVANVKLSASGFGSGSDTEYFTDSFTFYNDGSFEMIDVGGTYILNKGKFTVTLSNDDIASYMETMMEDILDMYGYTVDVHDVIISKNSFKGKESLSDGTISGKFKLGITLSIYFYDFGYNFNGKATATASFLGTNKIPLSSSSSFHSSALSKNPLAEIICNEILRSISNSGTAVLK